MRTIYVKIRRAASESNGIWDKRVVKATQIINKILAARNIVIDEIAISYEERLKKITVAEYQHMMKVKIYPDLSKEIRDSIEKV